MDEWMSVKDAAEKLNVSSRTVTNWINQRKLKAKRGADGREWLAHASLGPPPEDWIQDVSQNDSETAINSSDDAGQSSAEVIASSHVLVCIEKELEARRKEVSVLERTNDFLQKQLESRDEQINHLHQLLAISQTNLQREQLALEHIREQAQPWWKRLFNKSTPPVRKDAAVKGKTSPAFD
jgi:excisionase family DNA binding protein